MAQANIYLNFNGKTEEAFLFYKSVFGGEFSMLQRFGETPMAAQMPPAVLAKIMHVALQITSNCTLMGTDALQELGQNLTVGNNVSISLNTESREETERLFNARSVNGVAEMPLEDMFWGAYFGAFADQFGVRCMVNFAAPSAT